jgi:hypothetical protein
MIIHGVYIQELKGKGLYEMWTTNKQWKEMNNKNDGVQDTNKRKWWKEQKKNYTIGRYDKSIVQIV